MSGKKICSFEVDDRLFSQEAIFKTSYLFTDNYYVSMQYDREHFIKVFVEPKQDVDISDIDKKFCNELLAQMLRYRLSVENKSLKELIIGRALYSTCIETEENVVNEHALGALPECSLEDIAVDWFEIYGETD